MTTGYLDPNAYKKGKAACQTDRWNRDLMQIQLLILQMDRQLFIITAMIDRLRRRWGLQRGQQRTRRYWVRLWLSQADYEEEGQYTRLMPMLELDNRME